MTGGHCALRADAARGRGFLDLMGEIGAGGAHLPFWGTPSLIPAILTPLIATVPLPSLRPPLNAQTVQAKCERWGGAKPRALQGLEKRGCASREFPLFRSLKGVDKGICLGEGVCYLTLTHCAR
jgi:hypothetical protein